MVSFLRKAPVLALFFLLSACGDSGVTLDEILESGVLDIAVDSSGSLAGTVTIDGLGGCEGLTVNISGPAGISDVVSTADGAFELVGISAGAYEIEARADGYVAEPELFLYDGEEPLDVGKLTLVLETVPVEGGVSLSDGNSPAGSVVSLTGETDLTPPDGVVCAGADSTLDSLFDSSAIVDARGRYQTRVPRRGRSAEGTVERNGYSRERVTVERSTIEAASDDSPADLGEAVLYPLTGFVNIVGGQMQASAEIDLQISAFNAGEIAVQQVVSGGTCPAAAIWETFAAEYSYTVTGGDGAYTLCVRARNAIGDEVAFTTEVQIDTTPPQLVLFELAGGAAEVDDASVVIETAVVESGSGAVLLRVWDAASPGVVTTLFYTPVFVQDLIVDGDYNLVIEVEDAAGNVSVTQAASVRVDSVAPVPGANPVRINDDETGTNDRVVNVALDAAGASEMKLSSSQSLAGAAWEPFTTSTVRTLGAADGTHVLYARFRDTAGNETDTFSDTIVLDTSAPSGGSFDIVASAVSSVVLTLTLTANDASGTITAEIDENLAFTAPTTIQFPNGSIQQDYTLKDQSQGLHIVYVRYCDAGGNCVGPFNDQVELDTIAPVGQQATIVESPWATDRDVTLQLAADGADEVILSENADFSGAEWEPFGFNKIFTLANSEGRHWVWVGFRDSAGNTTLAVSATTELDLFDPAAPGVTIAAGAAAINEREVDVAINNQSIDAVELQLSEASDFAGANWIPLTNHTTFELSSGDESKTLFARVRDAAGRVSPDGQDSVVLDTEGPTQPSLDINEGEGSTNSQLISLAIGNQGDAVELNVSEDPLFTTGSGWVAWATPQAFTLSNGDGAKTVYIKTRDDVGNESVSNSDTIVLDTGVPGAPQLVIAGGGAYVQSANVILSLFATDADEMRISENASFAGAATWQPYTTSYAYTLTSAEGLLTLYAMFRGSSLNVTGPATDTVIFDGTPPAPGSGISINADGDYTASREVVVSLDVPGDASEIIVANNVGFAGVSWQSVTATVDWDLTAGDGNKTVYAKWRDAAGNEVATQSDAIILDTEAPGFGSPAIEIEGGDAYSRGQGDLNVEVSASGAAWVEIDDDQNFGSPAASTTYTTALTIAAPATDGSFSVYVRFADLAGNWTETRSDDIVIDGTAPILSDLEVNGDSNHLAAPELEIQLLGYDDNPLVEVQVSENNFLTWDTRPFEPSFDYEVTAAEGVSTVVSVRIQDAAGNQSTPLSSQWLRLDQTPPTAGSSPLVIEGGVDFTRSQLVALAIDAGDALEMRLSNNSAFVGAAWEQVTAETTWSLAGGDGVKQVFAEFRDFAGNTTGPFFDLVTLDTKAPQNVDIEIDVEEDFINSRVVAVQLSVDPDDTYAWFVSTDIGFARPVSGLISGGSATTVVVLPEEDGEHDVYVLMYDAAGNESAMGSEDVVLDQTAPELYYMEINNGSYFANDPYLELSLFAYDDNPIQYAIADTVPTFDSPASHAEPFSATLDFLHPVEGLESTVYVQLLDAAGNWSNITAEVVYLDLTTPTGTLVLDGNQLTSSREINFYFKPLSVDVIQFQANELGFPDPNAWQVYSGYEDFTLSPGDGARDVFFWVRDWAGNESPAYQLTMTLDTTAPTNVGFVIDEQEVTSTSIWTVNLAAGDADLIAIAENAGMADPLVMAPAATTEYELEDNSDGLKTLYVQYCDLAFNCTSVFEVDGELDTAAPFVADIGIDGGAAKTADPGGVVVLDLFAADTTGGSGIDAVRLGNTVGEAAANPPQPYELNKIWTLAAPVGDEINELKVVWAIFSDAANNLADPVSAVIEYDRVAPTGGLWFDDATTNDTLIGLNIFYVADAEEMRLSSGPSCAGGTWVAVTTQTLWNLSLVDGQQEVSIKFRDDAGNTGSCQTAASITLDTTGPLPSGFSAVGNLNADPGYSNTVSLELDGASGTPDCAWWELAEDPLFANVTDGDVGCGFASRAYTLLSDTDETKDLYIRFYDDLNNVGPVSQVSIILDQVPPQGADLEIQQGEFTTSFEIDLDLVAVGASQVALKQGASCTGGLIFDYVPTTTLTLTGGEGTKNVSAGYRDQAGNNTGCISRQVTVDTILPGGALTIQGDVSTTQTTSLAVTLAFSAVSADVQEVIVSNFPSFAGSGYQPYSANLAWALTAGDDIKTVYAQFRDGVGNESSVTFATIELDSTPPSNAIVLIEDDAGITNKSDLELQFSAVDASEMRFAKSLALLEGKAWSPYATTADIDVSGSSQGTLFVYAQFRDTLGNESEVAIDTIEYDTVPPTPSLVEILDGPFIASVSVNLSLSAADAATMIVSNDLIFNESVQGVAPTITHLLDPGDGGKQVHVRFFDTAGNWADLSSNLVTLDTVPPTAPLIESASTTTDAASFTVELFADTVTDANFAAFEVFGGSSFVTGFVEISQDINKTQFTFDLVADTENLLQIRAVDKAGNTSVPAQIVIIEDSQTPSPIVGIRGENGDEKSTLYWNAATETDVDGYWVYYGTQPRFDVETGVQLENPYHGSFADQGASPIWVDGRQQTSLTLSGLANGSIVYATIAPMDSANHTAEFGNEVALRPNIVSPLHVFPELEQLVIGTTGELLESLIGDAEGDIQRRGSYAFTLAGTAITVWNISNELFPTEGPTVHHPIAGAEMPKFVYNQDYDRLYAIDLVPGGTVVTADYGIAIFDASVVSPAYIGRISLGSGLIPFDIETFGDQLYINQIDNSTGVIIGNHEISVYSLESDPDAPVELPWAAIPVSGLPSVGFAVEENEEYLAIGQIFTQLLKYDISGTAPVYEGSLPANEFSGLSPFYAVGNTIVEVKFGGFGINLFDASGTSPVYITDAEATVFGNYGAVIAGEGDDILTAGPAGVIRYDISTRMMPTVPSELAFVTGNFNYAAAIAKDTAILATDSFDVDIYDTAAATGSFEEALPLRPEFNDLDVMHGLIAVAEGRFGIGIYEYASGGAVEIGRIDGAGIGSDVIRVIWTMQNGHRMLYALTGNPIRAYAINVNDPYNPTIASTMWSTTQYEGIDMAIDGESVYFLMNRVDGSDTQWLSKRDISSNPLNPGNTWCSMTAIIDPPFNGILAREGMVYLEEDDETTVIDFSASCPTVALSNDPLGNSQASYIAGEYIYLADTGSNIDRIDISDPNNIMFESQNIQIGDLEDNYVGGLVYSGSYIYLMTDNGLYVADISAGNFADLVGVGSDVFGGTRSFANPTGLDIEGNWAIGLTKAGGIQIWQIAEPIGLRDATQPLTEINDMASYDFHPSGHHALGEFGYAICGEGCTSVNLGAYDFSGVGEPRRTGLFNVPWGFSNGLFALDTAAGYTDHYVGYVGNYLGDPYLYMADVTKPSSPQTTQTLMLTEGISQIRVDGNRLYAEALTNRIDVYSIGETLSFIGSISTTYNLDGFGLGVEGGILWVPIEDPAGGEDLHIYSVAGDTFTQIDTIEGVLDATLHASRLYTIEGNFIGFGSLTDLKSNVYSMEKIYSGAGDPDLIATNDLESIFSSGGFGDIFAGGNSFSDCCSWLDVSTPGDSILLFNDDASSLDDIRIIGPHIFAEDFAKEAIIRYDME